MNLDYKFKNVLTKQDKKNILYKIVKGDSLDRIDMA